MSHQFSQPFYHNSHFFLGFIAVPTGQLKACSKLGSVSSKLGTVSVVKSVREWESQCGWRGGRKAKASMREHQHESWQSRAGSLVWGSSDIEARIFATSVQHTHIYIIYLCLFILIYTYIHTCVCVCVCVCVHTYIHIYIYIYKPTCSSMRYWDDLPESTNIYIHIYTYEAFYTFGQRGSRAFSRVIK